MVRPMPEGDAVWRTARRLDQALSGERLLATDLRVPSLATIDLSGAHVLGTTARGKHLLTRLSHPEHGALSLHTHLKMEGSWQIYRPDQRWRRPGHLARAVLTAAPAVAVGFSLGIVELLATADEPARLEHLGPDLLGSDWDPQEAVRRLRIEPSRPIWSALLDQRSLAGLGTIYAAETCFLLGVHPRCPVSDVPDLARLVNRAQQLLDFNKTQGSAITTGDRREPLWVYRRDRRPCLRCRAPIVAQSFDTADGPGAKPREQRARAAYWCPRCQPLPG